MRDGDVAGHGENSRLDRPRKGGVAAVEVEAAATARRRVAVQVSVAEGEFSAVRITACGHRLSGSGLCNGLSSGGCSDGQQQNESVLDPESHGVSSYSTVNGTVVVCCTEPLLPVMVIV